MRCRISIKAFIWLVILVTETSWANPFPENMPGQIVSAIEYLPKNKFSFSTEDSEGIVTTFVHACKDRAENYGLVPVNSLSQACWVYKREKRAIEAETWYEAVFRSNDDIDQNIGVFLTSQPEANKGSWTRRSANLCYIPHEGEQKHHFCLRSSGMPASSPIANAPANPENKSGGDGVFYGVMVVVLVVIGGLLGFAEYKFGCIRAGCKTYWNEW